MGSDNQKCAINSSEANRFSFKSMMGLPHADKQILTTAKKYTLLGSFSRYASAFSTTFFLISIAETLGNGSYIDGMVLVGFLIMIQMSVQTLLDYPTGVLADTIGHRWVFISAYITNGVAFFMVSLVTFSTPYVYFILIYALLGLADSQRSGTLPSWFDNNYKVGASNDSDRGKYGVFIGKYTTIILLVDAGIVIPSGIFAVVFSRAWVFQIQAASCILLSLIAFILMRNAEEIVKTNEKTDYFQTVKDGFRFVIGDTPITYFITGLVLLDSVRRVYVSLILFPMYYCYLITDVAVASFRTTLKIPDPVFSERAGVLGKNYDSKRWIARMKLLKPGGALFFFSLAATMFIFPPDVITSEMIVVVIPFLQDNLFEIPVMSLLPILFIFLLYLVTSFFGRMGNIMEKRILLDVVPNQIRNSVYSLIPTLTLLVTLPQIIFSSYLITFFGVPSSLILNGAVALFGVILIRKGMHLLFQKEKKEEVEPLPSDYSSPFL